MKVLATWSIKGGVGKTSAAVNLAWLAAAQGRRTLVWDLDPQGAATYLLRVKDKVPGGSAALVRAKDTLAERIRATGTDRLDVLPSNLRLRDLDLALDSVKNPTERLHRLLRSLVRSYDLVVLDCPPSVSLVSENVVHAADLVLVPVVPATLSVRTLDQLVEFVGTVGARQPSVAAFLSMADRRRALHRSIAEELDTRRDDVLLTAIPNSAVVERMGQRRAPVVATNPRSPAAQAYTELLIEVSARLWPALSVGSLQWGDR